MQNQNFDGADFLANLGEADISEYELFDKYPIKDIPRFLEALQSQAGDDKYFYLKLGLDGIVSKIGSFSFFILNSPTFRDLLQKSSQFSHIITDLISSIDLNEKPSHLEVIYNLSRDTLKLPNKSIATFIEVSYAGLAVLYKEMAISNKYKLSFHSSYDHELSDKEISDLLGHEFKSNCPTSRIIVPNAVLDIANLKYEANLPTTISHGLSKHLEAQNEGSMVSMISNLLEVKPASSLEDISDNLHISKRTLQRRLKDQNINFTSLKQSVAHQRSIELLNSKDHTIDEIADILGYSSTATFVHAFTKWQGMSPSAFLKQKVD